MKQTPDFIGHIDTVDGQRAAYHVHYLPLFDDIHGAVTRTRSGVFIVIIDDRLNDEEKAKTLHHELAHIRLGHLTDTRPLDQIEAEADAEADAETAAC